jgi:imidazolonepropionase-like amidohydrolase
VIDVGATNRFLKKRDSVGKSHQLTNVWMTGPLLTTYLPAPFKNIGEDAPFVEMTSEAQARELVREQVKRNADFIKIWYIVTDQDIEKGARKNLPLIQAVISEAHALNKRVAVHATERITAQLAVESGADFLVHSVDDEVIDANFVQLLKTHKVVLSPTLVVTENYNRVFGDYYHFTKEELAMAHPEAVATILDYPWPDTTLAKTYIKYVSNAAAKERQHKADSIAMANLKLLADAGVIIATGTDAGNIGTQHASSYFIELGAMKNAGLSNWQILQASTINIAKAAGQEASWGSIDAGKEANFLLLSKNPLDTLTALSSIQQIIHQGIAIKPDTLVKLTPELLVQQQLNAYNAHDLEAFLQPYSDSVEIYELTGKLLSKGKEQMRKDYNFLTQMPNLYCKLVNRMVMGNTVVDHEEIWLTKKPKNLLYGIAIYEIEKGKIQRVTFKQ